MRRFQCHRALHLAFFQPDKEAPQVALKLQPALLAAPSLNRLFQPVDHYLGDLVIAGDNFNIFRISRTACLLSLGPPGYLSIQGKSETWRTFSVTAGTVYDLLRARAESSPSSIALIAPVRAPLTYAGLCRHLEQVVGVLNSHGLGRGDRVALVLPNGPEMLTAFLAVACGAGAAPLNPSLTGGEFDSAFQDLRIGAVMVPASTESPARAVAKKRGLPVFELSFDPNDPAGIFTLGGRKTVSNPIRNPAFAGDDDIALVLRTSGAIARPKIVPLRQSALIAGADLTIGALHLAASDRYLCVMPMHHVHDPHLDQKAGGAEE